MKKVLMVCGSSVFENLSIKDVMCKKKTVGGNTGNLMFITGVQLTMLTDDNTEFICTSYRSDFTDAEIDYINDNCSCFVMPLADAFRENNEKTLKSLTRVIKKLRIPCYLIGVGLRAPYEPQLDIKRSFDDTVKDFIKAVLEKSSIVGVRGETTGSYLKKFGFIEDKDYMVIGCPSISSLLPFKKCLDKKHEFDASGMKMQKEVIITNTMASAELNRFIIDSTNNFEQFEVVVQKGMELESVFLGKLASLHKLKYGRPENVFGNELYDELYKRDGFKSFFNIYSWVKYMEQIDFCLSGRFHGGVAGLIAGTPTVVMPYDSRMRELVSYHKVPNVSINQIKNQSFSSIMEKIDMYSHLSVWEENFRRYVSFLNKNGIQHIYKDESENENVLDKLSKLPHEEAVKNFKKVNILNKAKRLAVFYNARTFAKVCKSGDSLLGK